MSFKKFKNLKVRPGAKSSRFVIDLKQDQPSEIKVIKKQEQKSIELKLERFSQLDYKKYFGAGKTKIKDRLSGIKGNIFKLSDQVSSWKKATAGLRPSLLISAKSKKTANEAIDFNGKRIIFDQLAFVTLFKLIYLILNQAIRLIYNFCYWVGWLIVFCIRLVYFLSLLIIKPGFKGLSFIARGFQTIISKSFNSVSGSFRSAQSTVLITAAKSKSWLKSNSDNEEISYEESEKVNRRPYGYLRPVFAFAVILLIMVLPIKAYTYYKTLDSAKGRVLGASESAINNLISGGEAAANLNFSQAGESFTRAGNNFLMAENQLEEINGLLFTIGSIIPDKNIQLAAAGKHIVRAGGLSAAAGKNLSLAVESLFNYQAVNSQGILYNLSTIGHQAIINLIDLSKELDLIDSAVIPADYQTRFILLKQKIRELASGLSEFISLTDQLDSFLGAEAAKRYLLIFQNNSELRASGGFIGSFALVDVLNGKIKKIEAPGGGSYDTDAGFQKKIKSPEPLRLVRPDWHFWDANWWPDWSASAKKLAWFYENSDGSTVDGVIGLTPTVMEEMLRIIGPVDLTEKYGVIIDADNFWRVTQEFAEQKPNVTKEPKKIIGDLMNKIIEVLPERLNKENLLPMLKAVAGLLSDKNILFYFSDNKLQSEAERLGWAGKIKETRSDYLSVINTNIAGGKSDRRIKQEIIHQAEVQPDGAIIDNLTVKRTHEAIKREPFSGVRNVNWLRVYVPLGSELISAEGFRPVDKIFFKEADPSWSDDPEVLAAESQAKTDISSGTKIYNELGKTVFANWSQLDPGETIEIKIKYRLPFKLTDKELDLDPGLLDQLIAGAGAVINPEQKNYYSYSMLLQKQPGMNSSTMVSELKLSNNFQPIWQFPADLAIKQNGWYRAEILDQDKLMAVMLEEK